MIEHDRHRKRERRARLTASASGPPGAVAYPAAAVTPSLSAIGLEAEFAVVLDGQPVHPENVFGSPRRIVRGPLLHRTGRSYHLPTGSAVYFDTGVIELATPMIELERGCAARAGRALWESIRFLRRELDAWQERDGRDVNLVGFSTHYNVSFDLPPNEQRSDRTVEQLALLLTYVLPAPVMLLAANRQSTGIGVRPRGNRVEVTADFTPDAALMIAAATIIVGIVRDVMTWPSFHVSELDRLGSELPLFRGFSPVPHSSRKGWVARYSCFPRNPFASHVNDDHWEVRHGEPLSLREIAGRTAKYFWPAIRRYADPFSLRLIGAVMAGRTPSLLELADRPPSYESVGRLCEWEDLFPEHELPRSRYERVLIRAIHGDRLHLADGDWYTPTGMRGWSHVVFRRERDRSKHVFSLDYLLRHLDDWDARSR
jgi:hypothetical protein